jgi:hypothetical protein
LPIAQLNARPLTPALSPEYEGEGNSFPDAAFTIILIFGISLHNVLRFGGTPQRLEVLKGELTYSRRGWVGIRRRHIPAGEVASIRFKPWKDVFLRKSRSGILRITSRDGRRIRIGMNGAAFALSADAVCALRQACGLPERDDGV